MRQMLDPYYEKLMEDEFYSSIENRDRKIEENNLIIDEQEKILTIQNAILEQINERKLQLSSVIKQMLDDGFEEKLIIKCC